MPVAVVILIATVLSGGVYGFMDRGWETSDAVFARGGELSKVPNRVGDWELETEKALNDSAAKVLKCYGSVVRSYKNVLSGDVVEMALLYGPRGPIAVHVPEVCFSSVGRVQEGPRRKVSEKTEQFRHEFWQINFSGREGNGERFRVYYAWSTGGEMGCRGASTNVDDI